MKIAILGNLAQKITRNALGGTEYFTYSLVSELKKREHKVILYALTDSDVPVETIGFFDSNILSKIKTDNLGWVARTSGVLQLGLFRDFLQHQKEFDFVHVSTVEWYYFLPLIDELVIPHCITVHSQLLDYPTLEILAKRYPQTRLIFISEKQKRLFPEFKYNQVIYNGIDVDKYDFNREPQNYISWLGRIIDYKGVEFLPKIASELPYEVRFGGGNMESTFFQEKIKPYLDQKNLLFLGPLNFEQKNDLFKNAKVMVNPIQWDEPFGLVVPEANACGTPVVAFARGSMPELIKDGINGFLVKPDDLEEMVKVVKAIFEMPENKYLKLRENCRKHVEDNFTIQKMTEGYEKVYKKALEDWREEK
ncbi:hypothetical protein A2V71_01160 [Candidatus Berkelbacteria bacterium RBG_13_40_8]|uniref:Glycosyl transferase family 1 domain-containing protein n=1 Tax=Candidatus Berkelbacteria bacterium RBG_13_40_8 TaxID=1797467 RepID=A0A1F5DNV5_9BACT|nr:MAG: hypothetical protein A2V71_01160 [Candidatus Berkelbacteria bacterium RBG_13_40_8]